MRTEKLTLTMTTGPRNHYKVNERFWKKLGPIGRHVFNVTYSTMIDGQWAFKHPKEPDVPIRRWKTTAWNAAWIAAEAARDAVKEARFPAS